MADGESYEQKQHLARIIGFWCLLISGEILWLPALQGGRVTGLSKIDHTAAVYENRM
jgi:hypothetical protein